MKHPKANLVATLVLGEEGKAEGTMEEALGLPTLPPSAVSSRETVDCLYNATDVGPYAHPEYPRLHICCVPLLTFSCHPTTAEATGAHFRKCADACWSLLGLKLSLDIGFCQRWETRALASLLAVAFPQLADDPMALYKVMGEERRARGRREGAEIEVWGWLRDKVPVIVAEIRNMKTEGGEKDQGKGKEEGSIMVLP